MSFFKSISRTLFNTFQLLAGPNPQTMQAHGLCKPISIPEDNPVTQAKDELARKRAYARASRVWIAEDGVEAKGGFADTQLFRS